MTNVKLKELVNELDQTNGILRTKHNTINNINTELGRISNNIEDVNREDLNEMGLTFRDIDHSIQLLSDLLQYTTKDLEKTINEEEIIQAKLLNLID